MKGSLQGFLWVVTRIKTQRPIWGYPFTSKVQNHHILLAVDSWHCGNAWELCNWNPLSLFWACKIELVSCASYVTPPPPSPSPSHTFPTPHGSCWLLVARYPVLAGVKMKTKRSLAATHTIFGEHPEASGRLSTKGKTNSWPKTLQLYLVSFMTVVTYKKFVPDPHITIYFTFSHFDCCIFCFVPFLLFVTCKTEINKLKK